MNSDIEFSDKMLLAQDWLTQRAKQVVAQAIELGNLKAAQWWLERKARLEFSANAPEQPEPYSNPFQKMEPEELAFYKRAIAAIEAG